MHLHISSESDLLTAGALAPKISMTEAAVRLATSRGRLPALRLGRRVRYRLSDVVAAFVPAQTSGSGR
jgi:hypothetical protein